MLANRCGILKQNVMELSKQLRIGNLLKTKKGSIIEVENVLESGINSYTWSDTHYGVQSSGSELMYEYDDLEPIKLDEEWLLKCKSNSIFNNGFEYKKTTTGRFEVYVGISLITVIEFVHELQNLNFSLLGQDIVFENV